MKKIIISKTPSTSSSGHLYWSSGCLNNQLLYIRPALPETKIGLPRTVTAKATKTSTSFQSRTLVVSLLQGREETDLLYDQCSKSVTTIRLSVTVILLYLLLQHFPEKLLWLILIYYSILLPLSSVIFETVLLFCINE